jgi:hypothetical protein
VRFPRVSEPFRVEVTSVDKNGFWIRSLDGVEAKELCRLGLFAGWRPKYNDAKQYWPKAAYSRCTSIDAFVLDLVTYDRIDSATEG